MTLRDAADLDLAREINLSILPGLRELYEELNRYGDLEDLQEDVFKEAISGLERAAGRLALRQTEPVA